MSLNNFSISFALNLTESTGESSSEVSSKYSISSKYSVPRPSSVLSNFFNFFWSNTFSKSVLELFSISFEAIVVFCLNSTIVGIRKKIKIKAKLLKKV